MAVINVLSPHLADMIAAGEVVERPASVIKELMENAFDAHAHNVRVELRGGGATYIRVTDDGVGMAPEDAGVAFLRHATSKLHDERGLEAIGTMGFRGEALAAISAVSRIELSTRLRGSAEGTRVTLDAGDIQEMRPCGCPEGTDMIVRDIFYNTPARLKFLKSDRSEASACVATALKCALGRPEISVRLIRDGNEEFFTPGDGQAEGCVYALLGRDIARELLPVHAEAEGVTVSGFVSSPAAGRGSRGAQYFFCNGRYIRSALLQAAVEQAYKNTLLTGRYPACVIYLTLGCAGVDVNVHPAKTEVKFSYERQIFDLVYHAALGALTGEARVPTAQTARGGDSTGFDAAHSPSSTKFDASAPAASGRGAIASTKFDTGRHPASGGDVPRRREDFYKSMSAREFREGAYSFAAPKSPAAPIGAFSATGAVTLKSSEAAYQTRLDLSAPANSTRLDTSPENNSTKFDISPAMAGQGAINSTKFDTPCPASSATDDVAPTKFDAPAANFDTRGEIPAPAPGVFGGDVENSVQNVETPPLPDHKIVGEALRTYIIVELGEELIFIDKHAAHERMIFDALKAQRREIMSQQLLAPVTLRLDGADGELIDSQRELLSALGFELDAFGARDYILRAVPADIDAGDAAAAIEEICEKLRAGKSVRPEEARDEILHTVACKAAIKAGWDTSPEELERVAAAVLSGRVKYCPHGRPVSFTMTRRELEKEFKRIV